jgi:hypothetical protein
MKWTMLRGRGGAVGAGVALLCSLTLAGAGRAAPGDRAAAQAVIAELGRDTDHHAVVAPSVERAQDAIERGVRMRAAGDEAHASEADALARQWAETGRELLRAANAEARANELRKKALDTQAQVAKTREIVEEVIARTGRLRAQIAAAQEDGGASRVAVEVHDDDRSAAARPARAQASPAPSVDAGAP